MRSREQIDEFVVEVVRRRLALPDLHDLLPSADEPGLREIKEKINEHRAKIHRAQRDYDAELIEGFDTPEVERLRLSLGSSHSSVLGARDPVAAFDAGDLANRRRSIDILCEVRLYPRPRGVKSFDPDSIAVTWR